MTEKPLKKSTQPADKITEEIAGLLGAWQGIRIRPGNNMEAEKIMIVVDARTFGFTLLGKVSKNFTHYKYI